MRPVRKSHDHLLVRLRWIFYVYCRKLFAYSCQFYCPWTAISSCKCLYPFDALFPIVEYATIRFLHWLWTKRAYERNLFSNRGFRTWGLIAADLLFLLTRCLSSLLIVTDNSQQESASGTTRKICPLTKLQYFAKKAKQTYKYTYTNQEYHELPDAVNYFSISIKFESDLLSRMVKTVCTTLVAVSELGSTNKN